MTHALRARKVHDMLVRGSKHIMEHGKGQESRNGPVLSLHEPCIFQFDQPRERVLFWPERDANPFFHLMESLWMIAGRNDVKYLTQFVQTMDQFSDDGLTFNGAYGFRWRHHFDRDQLTLIIEELKADHTSRRCVLGMWDPSRDLGLKSRDLPCNINATFRISDGALDMSVFNRSNDMIWGALGANAVHFSMLQEYVAAALGRKVGRYWQISTNMHVYVTRHLGLLERMQSQQPGYSPYETEGYVSYPLIESQLPMQVFDDELSMFLSGEPLPMGTKSAFLKRVAAPMLSAWKAYKKGDFQMALTHVYEIGDMGWSRACQEWLLRRRTAKAKRIHQQDDGVIYDKG